MPVDTPPPVIITALPEPGVREPAEEVYGPVDGEAVQIEEACEGSNENEIVVCAFRNDEQYRIQINPPPPTAMEEMAEKLEMKLGPADILPGGPLGTVGIGIRIRF